MNRREEILDAVLDIFKTKGISGDFTMTELASKLDIGKSTIYEYFKTKDEILTHAMYHMIELSTKSILKRTYNDSMNFEETLKAELNYLFHLVEDSRMLSSALTQQVNHMLPEKCHIDISERMKSVSEFYNEKFALIFTKGFTEGVLKKQPNKYDELISSSLVTGSVINFSNKLVDTTGIDLKEYIDHLYNHIVRIYS